jgi:hypothetical protein
MLPLLPVQPLPSRSAVHPLTPIQRYVLARVAVHTWTHGGRIPYRPPNAYQASVAFALAVSDVCLLTMSAIPSSTVPVFRLSHLGEHTVRRHFRLMSTEEDQRRELEFTKMRRLMQNAWEVRE